MAKLKLTLATLPFLAFGVSIVLYLRPLPALQPVSTPPTVNLPQPTQLAWPAGAKQSAIGADGYGLLASNAEQKPAPMASITKIITALAVLQKQPLKDAEQGPVITIGQADVGYYQQYAQQGGSVAKVVDGEQISEHQALEAMLLPSANNMAETLAVWAFGSLDKFIAYANNMTTGYGATSTTLADASGFSPDSVSTASDLVKIGLEAIKNPVLAEITSEKQATVPVAGLVLSTNWLLGTDGINGLKTGNTDEAGGCYLFSALQQVGNQELTVVGVILGDDSLANAVKAAPPLLNSASSNFSNVNLAQTEQVVGYYKAPWGPKTDVITKGSLDVLAWRGNKIYPAVNLFPLRAPLAASTDAGVLKVTTSSQTKTVNVITKQSVPAPTWHWRILRRN